MRGLIVVLLALAACASASAGGWSSSVPFTNQIASSPVQGGGYPVPDGATAPTPGTCRLGNYNANRSESWIAVQPGTENLVGASKFFFERWSSFYDFHLGSYSIPNGTPSGNAQVTGYDCISTGTQDMPPSWTNNTDPNVDFDSQGRAYQVTLPFNAYWVNLHPNGAIGVVYSDDLGRTWTVGNGGKYLSLLPNSTSLSLGDVVDKQWVAVNHVTLSPYRDHVYAMWSVFNGVNTVEVFFSKSVDRGATFSPARRITPPNQVGPANTYIYPSIDASGNLYASVASFTAAGSTAAELWVARSTDDGKTFTWFDTGQRAAGTPGPDLPNTTFRDGILENFAASPTYPGHLYLTYEDWDGTQMDVKFTQSMDGGATWSAPVVVNDNVDAAGEPTDQFQPSVAAGPGGAVAGARRVRAAIASGPRTWGGRTSASTRRSSPTRTAGAARSRSGRTSRCRSSPGTRWSRPSTWAGSARSPVRATPTRAWNARSSATTSGSRSRRPTSTVCSSRRTIRRASTPTRAAPSTTSSRCWRLCRVQSSVPGSRCRGFGAGVSPGPESRSRISFGRAPTSAAAGRGSAL